MLFENCSDCKTILNRILIFNFKYKFKNFKKKVLDKGSWICVWIVRHPDKKNGLTRSDYMHINLVSVYFLWLAVYI